MAAVHYEWAWYAHVVGRLSTCIHGSLSMQPLNVDTGGEYFEQVIYNHVK